MALAKAFSAAILERDLPLMSVFPIASALPGGIFESSLGQAWRVHRLRHKIALRANAAPDSKEAARRHRLPQGICEEAVVSAIRQVFADHALDLRAAAGVYSIDLKKRRTGASGSLPDASSSGAVLQRAGACRRAGKLFSSGFVASVTGVGCVCERAAMLGAERLLVPEKPSAAASPSPLPSSIGR